MHKNREKIYSELRSKMERAGFVFEKEQKPHLQNKRDKELKFIHPVLVDKLESDGYKSRSLKYYIKPLSDDPDSLIGLTTGKTSPLFLYDKFEPPNSIDTFGGNGAWVNDDDYKCLDILLDSIRKYVNDGSGDYLKEISESFSRAVVNSMNDSAEERLARLKKSSKKPEKMIVQTVVFKRNPDVVAEVLVRACGICEICGQQAPFLRAKDGTPYLEVHHKKQLSEGGDDTVENAIAVCPNCHRKQHFG